MIFFGLNSDGRATGPYTHPLHIDWNSTIAILFRPLSFPDCLHFHEIPCTLGNICSWTRTVNGKEIPGGNQCSRRETTHINANIGLNFRRIIMIRQHQCFSFCLIWLHSFNSYSNHAWCYGNTPRNVYFCFFCWQQYLIIIHQCNFKIQSMRQNSSKRGISVKIFAKQMIDGPIWRIRMCSRKAKSIIAA